jgi:hypothetical protein
MKTSNAVAEHQLARNLVSKYAFSFEHMMGVSVIWSEAPLTIYHRMNYHVHRQFSNLTG